MEEQEDFLTWVYDRAKEKGSVRKLAKEMGLSHTAVHNVINGRTAVTYEFCDSLAKAVRLPPDDIFRRAGLFPPVPAPGDVTYITQTTRALPADQIKMVREFVEFLYKKSHENR